MRKVKYAGVAQLVEQRIRNAQVVGSSPTTSLPRLEKGGVYFCKKTTGSAGGFDSTLHYQQLIIVFRKIPSMFLIPRLCIWILLSIALIPPFP